MAAPQDLTASDVIALRRSAAQHRGQGKLADAVEALRQAIAAAPDDADAHADHGLTLMLMGRPDLAEGSYRRALELRPDDIFSWVNLGSALIQLQRLADAEGCFRQVLALEPDHVAALRNLGAILKDMGRSEEARASFRRAALAADLLDVDLQAQLALSPITRSQDDIIAQRTAYAAGLATLASPGKRRSYAGERFGLPWFYLAYHGLDNLPLLERTAAVTRAMAGPTEVGATPRVRQPVSGRKLRVGFCSEYFHAHTIGRLYAGLLRQLDRSRFEVIVIHPATAVADALRGQLDSEVDQAVTLPLAPEAQRRQVADLQLDVLIYPDIGMSAQTYFLAQTRLAPVQVVSWGHPDTSGLETLDYYLSADGIEPEGAEARYVERLIRLPSLPCCYDIPAPGPAASRQALGLPPEGILYGCPQSLFKLHPDFDPVLAQIATGDPEGHIILLAGNSPAWQAVLRERWAASYPILLERVRFLPRLTHEGFMAHLAHIDVLLDPPHFGSGNTLYEAMAQGTPIVTWPGAFMRGRIVAGAYAQMEIERPPVAERLEDYAGVALQLGRDPALRARLRAELTAKARTKLYSDKGAVQAVEAFLAASVAAADAGQKLPSGWRPEMPA